MSNAAYSYSPNFGQSHLQIFPFHWSWTIISSSSIFHEKAEQYKGWWYGIFAIISKSRLPLLIASAYIHLRAPLGSTVGWWHALAPLGSLQQLPHLPLQRRRLALDNGWHWELTEILRFSYQVCGDPPAGHANSSHSLDKLGQAVSRIRGVEFRICWQLEEFLRLWRLDKVSCCSV